MPLVLPGQFLGQPETPPVFNDELRQAMAGFQQSSLPTTLPAGPVLPHSCLQHCCQPPTCWSAEMGMCRRWSHSMMVPTRCYSGPCARSASRSATSRTLFPPAASKLCKRIQTCSQQSCVHVATRASCRSRCLAPANGSASSCLQPSWDPGDLHAITGLPWSRLFAT